MMFRYLIDSENGYCLVKRAPNKQGDLEEKCVYKGPPHACEYQFKRLRGETEASFHIEYKDRIVAVQVWNEILWLNRVPPPQYFKSRRVAECGLQLPCAMS